MTGPRASRRQMLRSVVGTAAGIALGGVGTGCSGSRAPAEAVTVIELARLPEGEHLRIDHHGEPVDLLRQGDRVVARSLVCTHQYCRMFWHPATGQYRCPCHGATFDPAGRPASGPVTTAMWTLPARIEGGTVRIGGGGTDR